MKEHIRKISVKGMHTILNQLPFQMRSDLGFSLTKNRNLWLVDKLMGWYEAYRPIDAYLISFPKCGRTWLRLMIGHVFVQVFSLSDPEILKKMLQLEKLAFLNPAVPRIKIVHDDAPHFKKPDELVTSKVEYRQKKVIILIRDPKDAIVSAYFEQKKRAAMWNEKIKISGLEDPKSVVERLKPYDKSITEFVYEEVGSLNTFIAYYNIWAANRDYVKDMLIVRYEDMHRRPGDELQRVLEFMGVYSVDTGIIDGAIQYTRFDNMRKMEEEGVVNSKSLMPANRGDEDSYKTRKGKVGGYVDYLAPNEVDYINRQMREQLSDVYGYVV